MDDNAVLHVTPTEASEFVEWALLNRVFDERTKLALQAFAESRRRTYSDIRENIAKQHNDLRSFAHSRTPDQHDSAVIANHKAVLS